MIMAAGAKFRQISNARIAGMDTELGLDQGNRYSVALVVFFIPYLLFEVTITLRQHVFCGSELTVR